MWLASLILNTGSAISSFILKQDEFEAKKNLLQTNYTNQIQKLRRDLINYKSSISQIAASNNIDPSSPLIISELSKADALENDIETQGASNLSNQLDKMYTNVRLQFRNDLIGGFAKASYKGFEDYLLKKEDKE
ncbi:MAG: hypothetical protein ACRCST_11630 [Turicibacter sp.]